MKLIDRLAQAVGYAPLAQSLAVEQLASPWADTSNLTQITMDEIFGYAENIRVTRGRAMQVPAIATSRHTIVNTGGRLPLFAEKDNRRVSRQPTLLAQFERDVPRATTLGRIFDALFFYPCTWLHVTERDSYGWPIWTKFVRQQEARTDDNGNLLAYGDTIISNAADVIRFDSPLDAGLLANAARTIKRFIAIEEAASLAEANPVPTFELHNEGDKLSPEEIQDLLDGWTAARRKRGVAYTSKGVIAKPHGQQESQLLIKGRTALTVDLVRHANVPAWAAAVASEGATMSYENRGSRNWELIDLTLSAYFTAIAGRLSMPDVTPQGWTVKFDTDELTKPDQQTRFTTYAAAKSAGIIDNAWIAEQEGWARVPAEEATK